MKLKNIYLHLRKIQTHRKWVRFYCFGLGLYKQGLLHDLSKYSPTEFWESVKYYQGTSSPIDAAKKANGYSKAWFHHRGRNPHHHVYWCDNFDTGVTYVPMPYIYFAEMICDFLAAGRAYQGKDFTYASELKWWEGKRENYAMRPEQKQIVTAIFEVLKAREEQYGTLFVDEEIHCGRFTDTIKHFYNHFKPDN